MKQLKKFALICIALVGFTLITQAAVNENKESKSSFALDSTEIVKIKEFFGDIDLDSIKILKIKQLIPDLDTVKMRKIEGIIPMLDYYNDHAIEFKKKQLASDYIPEKIERAWEYFRPIKDTVIVKGSEVTWRFKFYKGVTYLELQGVGRASKKDIQAGKWDITTKPKRSTTYYIRYMFNNENRCTYVKVIVVESETEAQKVKDEMEKKREADRKNPHKTIRYQPSLYDRR